MYFQSYYSDFLDELEKRCFFIEIDNKRIATATISPANEYGYKCVIDWLAISKEYQGKHLAKPLICECLKLAKKLGNNKILLHTQTHTYLAAKLYLEMGFDPFNMNENIKGWQILKTLTNHKKLESLHSLENNEIFDKLSVEIVSQLNKLHKNYNYEIWYKNGMNDVYVHENNSFFTINFITMASGLVLLKKYNFNSFTNLM